MRSSSNNSIGYTELIHENSVSFIYRELRSHRIKLKITIYSQFLSSGNFYNSKTECYIKIER